MDASHGARPAARQPPLAAVTRVLGQLLLALVIAPDAMAAPAQPPPAPAVELFTRAGCPRCAAARAFLDRLRAEQPALRVVVSAVDRDAQARARLEALSARAGVAVPGVPSFAVGDALVVGFRDETSTGATLRALLRGTAPDAAAAPACTVADDAPCQSLAPAAAGVDTRLFGRFSVERLGLPLFTVALGLLDGFNPCAMWVLLFLLSLLVNLHSRRAMALIAGTFVLVSGAVYFAFMAAWLNVFLLIGISRPVQVAIGLAAATIGAINVKDFFAFRRGVSLTIPESAKPGLYARMRAVVRAEWLPASLLGVAVLAVLVNFVELLCTAGLPAVYTSVLAANAPPGWAHYGYLLLYTLAYLADDALMVGLAVFSLSRRRLDERGGRWLKLISGAVMLGLAALLLVWPDVLR